MNPAHLLEVRGLTMRFGGIVANSDVSFDVADGSITAWGFDPYGEVADTPTGTGFKQVAASAFGGIALRADGSIAVWGQDTYGAVSNAPTGTGFIAVGGIIINVIMQLTVMSMFGATLTLPGIAALVLTVGMDVDGNILIYERIRDELNLGKSLKGSIDIGFGRAFSTILDGHMTTAAAGWVLLQYGTGPIHGFAVLLLVGIGTTLFVNTWVTRLLFDWYVHKKKDHGTISI